MHRSSVYEWLHANMGEAARHALLYGTLLCLCTGVVVVGRWSRARGTDVALRVDRAWAGLLLGVWAVMVVGNLRPARLSWDGSLPLHICQLIALAAPIAVLRPHRWLRVLVYFWTLALSSQAFLQGHQLGPLTRPDTYVLWGYHETNLAAVAYDVCVRRYRPTWRDYRLNVFLIALYAVVVGSFDAAIGADYGMIGRRTIYPPVAAFGPWPTRVVWLALASMAATAVPALPWPENWPTRPPIRFRLAAAT